METSRIPYLGPITAGFPKASEGYEDCPIDLQALLVPQPAATFFFRVVGDDLRADGVPAGAVLVVDRSCRPRRGRLAVVEQDGAFLATRLGDTPRPDAVVGVVTASIVQMGRG
ncbi:MAG: LexA family transcriptional regulator [Phycisphaerae bacterium]|nr:LexA family transcriptional regulator [Phycisphaerae bacterium]